MNRSEARAILSYFIWVADFFLVPGRDKYTMWDRRPLGQILFDPNRLYDVVICKLKKAVVVPDVLHFFFSYIKGS